MTLKGESESRLGASSSRDGLRASSSRWKCPAVSEGCSDSIVKAGTRGILKHTVRINAVSDRSDLTASPLGPGVPGPRSGRYTAGAGRAWVTRMHGPEEWAPATDLHSGPARSPSWGSVLVLGHDVSRGPLEPFLLQTPHVQHLHWSTGFCLSSLQFQRGLLSTRVEVLWTNTRWNCLTHKKLMEGKLSLPGLLVRGPLLTRPGTCLVLTVNAACS